MKLEPEFERTLREAGAADTRAADVLALSDHFVTKPGAATPWDQAFARPAYLAYFLPLNYARLRAVFREVRRFLPAELIEDVVDFGSGSGATHFVLEDEDDLPARDFYCVERSARATEVHRQLATRRAGRWRPRFGPPARVRPRTLGVFSYSFLEMKPNLTELSAFDHLLIVEPSTRDCGRALMAWRQRLIDAGYRALAPCTHDLACPLLTESPRDWCHHRVAFEPPGWWADLEADLPMKNRTLTYSYLLVSRVELTPGWRGAGRVIGDTLPERGKTRQMICRGPHREFLSWLHRDGEPPVVPRGALIDGLATTVPKGGELRVTADTALIIET